MKNIFFTLILISLGFNMLAQDNSSFASEIIPDAESYQYSDSEKYQPSLRNTSLQENIQFQGHTYEYYHAEYKKAVSTEKTGKILMLAGGAASITGLLIGLIGMGMGIGGSSTANDVIYPGVGLAIGGFIVFNVGIPFRVTGKTKKRKNEEIMEQGWPDWTPDAKTLTFGATSNGVGLILQF